MTDVWWWCVYIRACMVCIIYLPSQACLNNVSAWLYTVSIHSAQSALKTGFLSYILQSLATWLLPSTLTSSALEKVTTNLSNANSRVLYPVSNVCNFFAEFGATNQALFLTLLFLLSFWDTTISNFLLLSTICWLLLPAPHPWPTTKIGGRRGKGLFAFSFSHTTHSLCVTGNTLWLQLQSLHRSQMHTSTQASPYSQLSHRHISPKLLLVKGSVPLTWCLFWEFFIAFFSH